MAVVKILRGEVTFAAADNSKTITLPESVTAGYAFPIIHSRNNGDSTYMGSAGNCMFRPINIGGTTFDIVRSASFQQVMIVGWQLVIFDSPVVNTETVTTTGFQTTTSSTWLSSRFQMVYMSGASNWQSNMAEISAYANGTTLQTQAPSGTVATIYDCTFDSNIDGVSMSGNFGGSSPQTVGMGLSPIADHVFSSMEIYAQQQGASADGRDIYTVEYDAANNNALFKTYNPTQSGKFRYSGNIFADDGTNFIVQQIEKTLSLDTDTVTLSQSVSAEKTMFFFGGECSSYGRVDTYEEEHGDFAAIFTPTIDGGGNTTGGSLTRGERSGSPAATFILLAVTFGEGGGGISNAILKSIFKGVGIGVMTGVY